MEKMTRKLRRRMNEGTRFIESHRDVVKSILARRREKAKKKKAAKRP